MFKDLFSRYKKQLLSVFYVLFTVLVFLVSQFVGIVLALAAFQIAGYKTSEIESLLNDSTFAQFFVILVIDTVLVSILYSLYLHKGKSFLGFFGFKKKINYKNLKYVAMAFAYYFAIMVIVTNLIDAFVPVVDVDQEQQIGFKATAGISYIFTFISLVILPPLVEETLFRGYLYRKLKSVINLKVAAVISSLVFAVAHLELALRNSSPNWIAAVDTFVLAIMLVWVYEKTKNLWFCVALHALKNLIGFIFIFFI